MKLQFLGSELYFPDPSDAVEGLVAVGGDLGMERLLLAYSRGIFPWGEEQGEILWWSPDPRAVIYPAKFHTSKRLLREMRRGRYDILVDHDFAAVIKQCATIKREGQKGTWINKAMLAAYLNLFEQGYAHSFEVYHAEDLVGGLYGVYLRDVFFAESMYYTQKNASKIALAALVNFCVRNHIKVIDCQFLNPHLVTLGAEEISRQQFLNEISILTSPRLQGSWKKLLHSEQANHA